MGKTLYVTDLDGTLMHNDKTLSTFTIDTLNQLIDQGMLITYATARTFQSAWEITKDIHFNIPVITRNGTVFANQILKKETEIAFFSKEQVVRLANILSGIIDRIGFVSAYSNGQMTKSYRDGDMGKGLRKYIDEHASDKRMRALSEGDNLFHGDVTYVTLIEEKNVLQPVYDLIKDADDLETVFQKDIYGDEYWLEICPKNATKAKAVLELKERFGCERVVVFGDSMNDLSMFGIADESCAVENALKEVKDVATTIIPDNENDGVAKYLSQFLRI